jgi:hypothetical protein
MLACYQLRFHGVPLRTLVEDLDAYDIHVVGRERALDHGLSLAALQAASGATT